MANGKQNSDPIPVVAAAPLQVVMAPRSLLASCTEDARKAGPLATALLLSIWWLSSQLETNKQDAAERDIKHAEVFRQVAEKHHEAVKVVIDGSEKTQDRFERLFATKLESVEKKVTQNEKKIEAIQ